ncbi:unnamed protein product [Rhizoctonia solani]|uniref:Uncharacterized protein n=1 Tax=Rhizoctonia solani TaxID=456999 RepID=A0A8H3H7S4_9AGAM|nr:unnamed protein product [Rhizoctonia solani]
MSHSARSSFSDSSVQTLPLTPAPSSHKRTPSRTYFSLAEDEFTGPADNVQPEAELARGFEKLGFGESVAIGLSMIAVLSLAIVAATVTLLKVKCRPVFGDSCSNCNLAQGQVVDGINLDTTAFRLADHPNFNYIDTSENVPSARIFFRNYPVPSILVLIVTIVVLTGAERV